MAYHIGGTHITLRSGPSQAMRHEASIPQTAVGEAPTGAGDFRRMPRETWESTYKRFLGEHHIVKQKLLTKLASRANLGRGSSQVMRPGPLPHGTEPAVGAGVSGDSGSHNRVMLSRGVIAECGLDHEWIATVLLVHFVVGAVGGHGCLWCKKWELLRQSSLKVLLLNNGKLFEVSQGPGLFTIKVVSGTEHISLGYGGCPYQAINNVITRCRAAAWDDAQNLADIIRDGALLARECLPSTTARSANRHRRWQGEILGGSLAAGAMRHSTPL